MKLAFTTLGCPAWDLKTICRQAKNFGFGGIEIRGYMGNMNVHELPEFTSGAAATRKALDKAGIELFAFGSSARIFRPTPEERAQSLTEVKMSLDLCRRFGAKLVRVFGGDIGAVPRTQAIESAANLLSQMAAYAADAGVTLVLETHDAWTSSAHVRAVLERVASPAAAALWDIQHPFRVNGESPADTWACLGPWIKATHWKDYAPAADTKDGFRLCSMGEGCIPLFDCLKALARGNYDGYLTVEWEKKWHPELAEPEIAFPQFAAFMRHLAGQV